MNIFVPHTTIFASVISLDDSRVRKMLVETSQLLSTALHLRGDAIAGICKPAYQKHPCTIWAAESKHNWLWLYEYFEALCDEYKFRFFSAHKSALSCCRCLFAISVLAAVRVTIISL